MSFSDLAVVPLSSFVRVRNGTNSKCIDVLDVINVFNVLDVFDALCILERYLLRSESS